MDSCPILPWTSNSVKQSTWQPDVTTKRLSVTASPSGLLGIKLKVSHLAVAATPKLPALPGHARSADWPAFPDRCAHGTPGRNIFFKSIEPDDAKFFVHEGKHKGCVAICFKETQSHLTASQAWPVLKLFNLNGTT